MSAMILGIVLLSIGFALFIPGAILLVETIAAAPQPPADPPGLPELAPRMAILVPAHDESLQIANTVTHLRSQLGAHDDLIVIADNCRDDTAALARQAGAKVIERRDPEHRGKGYAIAFGLSHLAPAPPPVVVLVDADCRVNGRLSTLAALAERTGRPVQAEYVLTAPPRATPMTAVSGLAILVRNRVRPRGLHRLGFPCHLTGSGMAFPWRVLREAPETGANLVEDLVMGIEMAIAGHPPLLCPAVAVTSDLPSQRDAQVSQRKRWEHGQLHTLLVYVPRLLRAGLARRRLSLVALGLDLAVPPLALLTALESGLFIVAALGWLTGVTSAPILWLAAADLALVALAIVLAWCKFARETIPWRYGVLIPFYVLRKLPLYASLLLRGKQKTWERTKRVGEDDEDDEDGEDGGAPPKQSD